MKKQWVLRQATASDLDEMIQLFSDVVSNVNARDYTPEQLKEWLRSSSNTERWQALISEQYVVVAQHGDDLVGFASLTPDAYLDFMYVHKDHQRKGVAQTLYDHLEQQAEETNASKLQSDVSITARPFFERQGFKVVRTNHNQRNKEVLINYRMEKVL
ncbi:MAG: GNAT family N-acetyltransferase [Bacteroidia bacterium]|nr:GNAT family N-acetyltransferase [Bacteroidia bacterium]